MTLTEAEKEANFKRLGADIRDELNKTVSVINFFEENYPLTNFGLIAPAVLVVEGTKPSTDRYGYFLVANDHSGRKTSWFPMNMDGRETALKIITTKKDINLISSPWYQPHNDRPLYHSNRLIQLLEGQDGYIHDFGILESAEYKQEFDIKLVVFDTPDNFQTNPNSAISAEQLSAVNWLYQRHKRGLVRLSNADNNDLSGSVWEKALK